MKDNDVIALRIPEFIGQAASENLISDADRRLHGSGRNSSINNNKLLQQHNNQNDNDDHPDIAEQLLFEVLGFLPFLSVCLFPGVSPALPVPVLSVL